jgi:hypothetical protein
VARVLVPEPHRPVTRIGVAVALAVLASAGGAAAACRDDPGLAGPCFAVRGRLSTANGAPTFRIWPVGTRRLLGVRGDVLPECLRPHVGFDRDLYADFVVCPLTRERPGHMRAVCVASAANMTVRDEAGARSGVEGTCTAP